VRVCVWVDVRSVCDGAMSFTDPEERSCSVAQTVALAFVGVGVRVCGAHVRAVCRRCVCDDERELTSLFAVVVAISPVTSLAPHGLFVCAVLVACVFEC
jgi:hypothetical protein